MSLYIPFILHSTLGNPRSYFNISLKVAGSELIYDPTDRIYALQGYIYELFLNTNM